MLKKQGIEEKINCVMEIAEKYAITNLISDLEDLKMKNRNYKVHILMVGEFNAGKSALLNRVIGKEVLTENQAPETAVAAELYFSEQEGIIANDADGERRRYSLSEFSEIDGRNVRYLECYLDSENLRNKCDYVLVDTPGFDSGIERHNKALIQYIEKGTVYFLVVDCEKGTISESALNFICEIANYSEDIAVIINKCDKRTKAEAEEVKEYISDLLQSVFGREFPILCTSRNEAEADKKLLDLIQKFQAQDYYEREMTLQLDEKREALLAALELIKNSKECDTKELEKEIQNREAVKKRLLDQVEAQKKKISIKLHREIKERIIGRVNDQLNNGVPSLVNAYKGGEELFQEKVIELIRPILITEMGDYSAAAYENFIDSLNFYSADSSLSNELEEVGTILMNVCEKLRVMGENQSYRIPVQETDAVEFMEGKKNMYRIVSSALAIVTNFIAPPLELIIVFLPDIIRLIQTFLGTSKEQQLADAVRAQMIPQIVSKLRMELDKPLEQVEAVMAENIGLSIQNMLDVENQALEAVKNKKEEIQQNYAEFLDEIEKDRIFLQEL